MSGPYSSQINQSAKTYNVDPQLVKAVATQESSLGSTSSNIMQVNGMDGSSASDIIDAGTSMLAQYVHETGSIPWALAMYNMGPGILAWAQHNNISDPEQAMPAFSQYMIQQHGYSGYGDPQYIQHVMRYYN